MSLDIVLRGLATLSMVGVMAMLMVIVAMGVDLMAGWRKAKMIGEARTSYGLSRTFNKFLIYEGILVISMVIDSLLHVALMQWQVDYIVPCATLLFAVFECAVELWSVYEKAEDKQRRKAEALAQAASHVIDKNELAETIARAMTIALTKQTGNEHDCH